jgi:diguanylate cyclase (GGDEF)-like protein
MSEHPRRLAGRFATSYMFGRLIVGVSLIVLDLTGLMRAPTGYHAAQLLAIALYMATGLTVFVAYLFFRVDTRKMLLTALPFDLASTGVLIFTARAYQDPVYALLVAITVVYAVALPDPEAHLISWAVGGVYMVAHFLGMHDVHTSGDYVLLMFKAAGLVFISHYVAGGMQRQLEREAQLEESRSAIESLNQQLQRRLGELNAVSEITEVVHSSLDFDAIGALVLEIIQKVIDVPACSLLVLDKQKAETLFSASAGLGALPPSSRSLNALADGGTLELEGELFSCLTLLDHAQMMVVFCASAEHIESMRLEDRLVLQAVASELAVAVENSQLYKLTKRLSITDELTGLHNYRFLHQRLEEEFDRAVRYQRPLSLLMIDTDDFKAFNDSFGHVAGDRALAEIGGLLKGAVREIDVPARYGGEEFSVILPETDAAGAFVVAEKIRESISTHRFADADGKRSQEITISAGLATFPMHCDDCEGLLRQADDALYQAKHLGRDRVRSAQPVVKPLEAVPPLDLDEPSHGDEKRHA